MTLTTALLIDIDGVLVPHYDHNPKDLEGWPLSSWTVDAVYFESVMGTATITWSTLMLDRLRQIAELPTVEPMWCTTWQDHAIDTLAPAVGIGENWAVARNGPATSDRDFGWWKANRAYEATLTCDRVVWIDDDIDAWKSTCEMEGRTAGLDWLNDDKILTICPRTVSGLTPEHLDQIMRWLA